MFVSKWKLKHSLFAKISVKGCNSKLWKNLFLLTEPTSTHTSNYMYVCMIFLTASYFIHETRNEKYPLATLKPWKHTKQTLLLFSLATIFLYKIFTINK